MVKYLQKCNSITETEFCIPFLELKLEANNVTDKQNKISII